MKRKSAERESATIEVCVTFSKTRPRIDGPFLDSMLLFIGQFGVRVNGLNRKGDHGEDGGGEDLGRTPGCVGGPSCRSDDCAAVLSLISEPLLSVQRNVLLVAMLSDLLTKKGIALF